MADGLLSTLPMMILFNIVAGVASILGLIASFAAFRQARKASSAAVQARDSVLRKNLADEIESACVKSDQLLELLQKERYPEAAMRAHELASATSEIAFRRSPFLTEACQNDVLNTRTQAESISDAIDRSLQLERNSRSRAQSIRVARTCSLKLREILGTIRGELDRQVTPENLDE